MPMPGRGFRSRDRANKHDQGRAKVAQLHAVRLLWGLFAESGLDAEPEHPAKTRCNHTEDCDPAGFLDRFSALAPLAKVNEVCPDFEPVAIVHAEGCEDCRNSF